MEQKRDQTPSTYLNPKKTRSGGGPKEVPDKKAVLLNDEAAEKSRPSCSLPVHVNRTEFQQQDVLVPWRLKQTAKKAATPEPDKVFHRYYHVFQAGELRQCCEGIDGVRVVNEYYDEGNWAVEFVRSA